MRTEMPAQKYTDPVKTVQYVLITFVLLAFVVGGINYFLFEDTLDNSEVVFKNGLAYKKQSSDPFTENVVTNYRNGQKKIEAHFKEGLQDGLTTEWYENGTKKREVAYKKNKLNGLSVSWYENGKMQSKVQYKDDIPDGEAVSWYSSGVKKEEAQYKQGKANGLLEQW